jgi:hypothetical protein
LVVSQAKLSPQPQLDTVENTLSGAQEGSRLCWPTFPQIQVQLSVEIQVLLLYRRPLLVIMCVIATTTKEYRARGPFGEETETNGFQKCTLRPTVVYRSGFQKCVDRAGGRCTFFTVMSMTHHHKK